MFKISLNEELLNTHINAIKNKLGMYFTDEAIQSYNLEEVDEVCLNHIKEHLTEILQANPKDLKKHIQNFENTFPNAIGIKGQKKDNWHPLYKVLREEIFEREYSNWGGRKSEYGVYKFVETLGLKTCPYCNRNYTFIVDDKTGQLRPEVDHFHPKSLYPFLAMSFYNLIPSCPTCNHTKKDKAALNLVNPYDFENEDIKLTYIPKNTNFTNVESEKYDFESFEIEFSKKTSNVETFKLEQLYKQHKDIVVDLLIKKMYYPDSYVKELESFGFDKDDIYRFILNSYNQEEDLHKRPLSKLIKDISEELELI